MTSRLIVRSLNQRLYDEALIYSKFSTGDRMKFSDKKQTDGSVYLCLRKINKNGGFSISKDKYQHDLLKPFAGQFLVIHEKRDDANGLETTILVGHPNSFDGFIFQYFINMSLELIGKPTLKKKSLIGA